jgi:hypothetical protein
MSAPARLHPADVEAIAQRVVELLDESRATAAPAQLLTPPDVGAQIGRSAEWVRDHRGEFTQARLTDGERPRLLFTAESVDAWLEERSSRPAPTPEPPSGYDARVASGPRRRRRRPAPDVELLPVRGSTT